MVALTVVGFGGLILITGLPAAISSVGTIYFHRRPTAFHFQRHFPCFLLMGFFAMQAGIGHGTCFDAGRKWLGSIAGRVGGRPRPRPRPAFGARVPAPPWETAKPFFTKLALPEMNPVWAITAVFAAASIAIAGTLAAMIPPQHTGPSFYGILTDFQHRRAFSSRGIIPGESCIAFPVVYDHQSSWPCFNRRRCRGFLQEVTWKGALSGRCDLVGAR